MEITRLFHRPDLLDHLAALHGREWQDYYPGWDTSAARAELLLDIPSRPLPSTLVAVRGNEALGSVSLVQNDLPGWEHLNPWLGSLLVVPHHRSLGVGRSLHDAALALARSARVARLHAFTATAETYFLKLGWSPIGTATCGTHHVTVLAKDLGTAHFLRTNPPERS